MSVTCVIYGASDREIAALLESPTSIHRFLADAIRIERPGWIAAFFGRRPKRLPPARPVYDLGKSWGAVHYALNGTRDDVALPKGFITSGGANIGDEDVGYGPARALTASAVQEIAAALEQVTVAEFEKNIDGKKMRPLHVYGAPPSDNPQDAEYLVNDFDGLRGFLVHRAPAAALPCSKLCHHRVAVSAGERQTVGRPWDSSIYSNANERDERQTSPS